MSTKTAVGAKPIGRYARHIGRIGALAVALGVGAAVATSQGAALAHADTASTDKSTDAPSANQPAAGDSQHKHDSVDTAHPASPAAAQTDDPTADGPTTDSDATADIASGSRASAPKAAHHDSKTRASATTTRPPRETDADTTTDADRAVDVTSASPAEFATPTKPVAAQHTSMAVKPTAVSTSSTRTAAAPAPNPIAALSTVPLVAVNVVATVAQDLLAPLVAPKPTAPTPLLWTVLSWVRRETDPWVKPTADPTPTLAAAKLAAVTTSAAAPGTVVEAESMAVTPATAATTFSDETASGGTALRLSTNSTASVTLSLPVSTSIVVRAKGEQYKGAPTMAVSVDGKVVSTQSVSATSWTDYTTALVMAAGTHTISVAYTNDQFPNVKPGRNLLLDSVTVVRSDVTSTDPFRDDFTGKSGSAPNSAVWRYDVGSSAVYGYDNGIETYTNAAKNVYLDGNGHLVIQAVKTKDGYTSGRLVTRGNIDFGYGTVSASIQVPSGQGLVPAFWMEGNDTWPAKGEVDVIETINRPTTYYQTIHGPTTAAPGDYMVQAQGPVADLSTGFHTYWVTRAPDRITMGIDGVTTATFTPDSLPPDAIWAFNDNPMYLLLNVAVGGPWAGAPDSTTPTAAKMVVDWVQFDPA
jgi:beta-glucanase (GH16 family)